MNKNKEISKDKDKDKNYDEPIPVKISKKIHDEMMDYKNEHNSEYSHFDKSSWFSYLIKKGFEVIKNETDKKEELFPSITKVDE